MFLWQFAVSSLCPCLHARRHRLLLPACRYRLSLPACAAQCPLSVLHFFHPSPGPIHTSLALSHPLLLGPVSLRRMSDIAVRLCVCVCVPQGQVGQMGLRSQLMCAPAPRAPASPRARPRAFTRLCA